MDQIDTPIAISMAVLAGLLAIVTVFANKASGEMLAFQAKANNLQAQANMNRTKATDTWSFFQAKTLRKHLYRTSGGMLHSLNLNVGLQQEWLDTASRYTAEASELKTQAVVLDVEADKLQKEANRLLQRSIHENRKGDTLDLSRLCSELGLVLCSIALISKRRFLWVFGLLFGIGACSIYAYVMVHLW